jgi:hypothetical protein
MHASVLRPDGGAVATAGARVENADGASTSSHDSACSHDTSTITAVGSRAGAYAGTNFDELLLYMVLCPK